MSGTQQSDATVKWSPRSLATWLDVAFDVVMFGFGVLFLVMSPALQLGNTHLLGAGAFPLFMSSLLVIFAAGALAHDIRRKYRRQPAAANSAAPAVHEHPADNPVQRGYSRAELLKYSRVGLLVVGAVCYLIVLNSLGIMISTALLAVIVQFAALHKRISIRTVLGIVIFGAAIGVVVQLLFVGALHIELPLGPIPYISL